MTVSVVGVSLIQFSWIREALELNKHNFDHRVYLAINKVKERLIDDLQTEDFFNNYKHQQKLKDQQSRINLYNEIVKNPQFQAAPNYKFEIWSNLMLIDPESVLEGIDNKKLDKYLNAEFQNQGIDLNYKYGVYSNKTKSFLILNGNYVAEIGQASQASNILDEDGLNKTDYSIPLFDIQSEDEPGYLNLYFPQKSEFLWRNLLPILLSSIFFTGLILVCFSYTIYIILRQKRLSIIKTDFINNMTHEFKTPIATISLASDSILSPKIISSAEKIGRFVGIIKEENRRMLNQVEKVLQMAQIDKQELTLKYVDIDIHSLIEKAVAHASLKIEARGGSIETKLNATNYNIKGDQTHISNVISNLLDNAEKYTQATPSIAVRSENIKKGILISVSDNGIGMSKEATRHIFEKFYRIPTGNVHNVKGFGLGLAYVKAIVDAHRGKINVDSELEKGSTFSIYLPFFVKND